MAVTGAGLFVFAIGHMLGNLQIFLGPEAINGYAAFLHSNKQLLWSARIGLGLFVLIHIWTSTVLTLENRAARAQAYEKKELVAASYASRTMFLSGLIVAVFVLYHLLHFTVRVKAINLTGEDFVAMQDAHGRHDVFRMMVVGFSNPWVSAFYVLGVALLCLHLSHGASAMFQSLGLRNDVNATWIDRCAKTVALILFVGYVSVPLAVLAGWVK